MKDKMGNHSDTGQLLEEVRERVLADVDSSTITTLEDEFGNKIQLDKPHEEFECKTTIKNPSKLKDSRGREVDLIREEKLDFVTLDQIKAAEAKRNRNERS